MKTATSVSTSRFIKYTQAIASEYKLANLSKIKQITWQQLSAFKHIDEVKTTGVQTER